MSFIVLTSRICGSKQEEGTLQLKCRVISQIKTVFWTNYCRFYQLKFCGRCDINNSEIKLPRLKSVSSGCVSAVLHFITGGRCFPFPVESEWQESFCFNTHIPIPFFPNLLFNTDSRRCRSGDHEFPVSPHRKFFFVEQKTAARRAVMLCGVKVLCPDGKQNFLLPSETGCFRRGWNCVSARSGNRCLSGRALFYLYCSF